MPGPYVAPSAMHPSRRAQRSYNAWSGKAELNRTHTRRTLTVTLAARVGEKFELLGENPMGERIIATPVPVANRLLIRGDRHLFCIAAK